MHLYRWHVTKLTPSPHGLQCAMVCLRISSSSIFPLFFYHTVHFAFTATLYLECGDRYPSPSFSPICFSPRSFRVRGSRPLTFNFPLIFFTLSISRSLLKRVPWVRGSMHATLIFSCFFVSCFCVSFLVLFSFLVFVSSSCFCFFFFCFQFLFPVAFVFCFVFFPAFSFPLFFWISIFLFLLSLSSFFFVAILLFFRTYSIFSVLLFVLRASLCLSLYVFFLFSFIILSFSTLGFLISRGVGFPYNCVILFYDHEYEASANRSSSRVCSTLLATD